MFKIILCILLLFPTIVNANTLTSLTGPVSILKWGTLYRNPIANFHSPEFSITVDNKLSAQCKLGGTIGVFTYTTKRFDFQLGLEAVSWFTLTHKENNSFLLLTEDFVISVPVAFKYRKTTFAIKWNHISAHLGDGSGDIQDTPDQPFIYSREFISFHAAREYYFGKHIEGKVYLHFGSAYNIFPKRLSGSFLGAGIENVFYTGILSPYIAFETEYNKDVSSFDLSAQVGIWLLRRLPGDLSARAAITVYHGKDRRGQMLNKNLTNTGIGIFLR